MTELGGAVRRIWDEGRRIEKVAYLVGGVLFVSGVVHVVVLVVTGRTWIGPLSLRKAATFGLSFGLTLASVAWATSFLRLRARAPVLGAFLVACVTETALVTLQAWRGVPSHFNFETPFDTAVSMTLALGGGVIVVVGIACTAAAFAGAAALAPSLRLAVRAGLVVLLVALGTGAVMIARGVLATRSGNPGIAYDTAGSLKPLHAVAMHAVLVLPAPSRGCWATRRGTSDGGWRWCRSRLSPMPCSRRSSAIEAFADIPPLAPPSSSACSRRRRSPCWWRPGLWRPRSPDRTRPPAGMIRPESAGWRNRMSEFGGRVAVVTGAGSGIGRALAIDLARRGARVAVSDVDEKGLAETVDQLADLGVEHRTDPLDVTDRGGRAGLRRRGRLRVRPRQPGLQQRGHRLRR